VSRRAKRDAKALAEWVQTESPEAQAENAKVAALEAENAKLRKQLGLIQSYSASAPVPPVWARPTKKPRPGAATACLQLSDLHLDEVVNPEEVGGLNAYSREIAEKRLKRWALKACELGDMHRHAWDGAVVFLGGDLVSGAIHDELKESNADFLPGTMIHWAPLLAAAIKQVADFYGRVHVPSVVGNHGRLTIKKQAKGRGRNSWDFLLAEMVRSHFTGDDRVTWDVSGGSYLFVPVYGDHYYLTHGDEVGGGSGWAGIWSPLGTIARRGAELGQAHGIRPCAAVVGHWHQLVQALSRGLALNGSLKGWDEFACTLRFRPEPAQQAWWVHTPTHGATLAGPVLVEDAKAEGWK
jgi:hypothetical protein